MNSPTIQFCGKVAGGLSPILIPLAAGKCQKTGAAASLAFLAHQGLSLTSNPNRVWIILSAATAGALMDPALEYLISVCANAIIGAIALSYGHNTYGLTALASPIIAMNLLFPIKTGSHDS